MYGNNLTVRLEPFTNVWPWTGKPCELEPRVTGLTPQVRCTPPTYLLSLGGQSSVWTRGSVVGRSGQQTYEVGSSRGRTDVGLGVVYVVYLEGRLGSVRCFSTFNYYINNEIRWLKTPSNNISLSIYSRMLRFECRTIEWLRPYCVPDKYLQKMFIGPQREVS